MGLIDFEEEQPQVDKSAFYHIRIKRSWFRGKDVFSERLMYYKDEVLASGSVLPALNAGNMVYIMLRQLQLGVEWEKQDALIASYRDLLYKLSYVKTVWLAKDINYVHMSGEKSDVMWALSFMSQVFADEPMLCETVVEQDPFADEVPPVRFAVQNGSYTGKNALAMAEKNDALPDIWNMEMSAQHMAQGELHHSLPYDPNYLPESDALFGLPDGRMACYVRMDERYAIGEQYGTKLAMVLRHNISASLIKDFQDLVYRQVCMDYEVYHMRYIALMNKVHEIEKLIGGLEVSTYDILPIGERGLPQASMDTLERTNAMDAGSITYVIDRLKQTPELSKRMRVDLTKEVSKSIVLRLNGYDTEYQTYQMTGTSEELCQIMRMESCTNLYQDFAVLDAMGKLPIPKQVYRTLCNDPAVSVYQMTEFERQKLRTFGRGYADFLAQRIADAPNKMALILYKRAMGLLQKRYLEQLR